VQQEASKVEHFLGEEEVEVEARPSLGEAAEEVEEEEAWSVVVLLILFRSVRSPDATGFEFVGLY
jgi:hypothetical protein